MKTWDEFEENFTDQNDKLEYLTWFMHQSVGMIEEELRKKPLSKE